MNRRTLLRSLFVAPFAAALAKVAPAAKPVALPPIQPRFSFKSRGLVGQHIDRIIMDDIVGPGEPLTEAHRRVIAEWSENWHRSQAHQRYIDMMCNPMLVERDGKLHEMWWGREDRLRWERNWRAAVELEQRA